MTVFPNWSYASLDDLKTYIGGSLLSMDWDTTSGSLLLRMLEAASRRCEQFVNRIWAPRTETVSLDLGRGGARDDRLSDFFSAPFAGIYDNGGGQNAFAFNDWPDYWPSGFLPGRRVTFADWLLTPTTVTSYADTARSTTQVLTQGITSDYLLGPPDGPPYRDMVLTETSNAAFGRGQAVLTITGEWGWPYQLEAIGTLGGNLSSSATSFSPAVVGISAGQMLRIGTESIYVTTSTLTLRRGVAGTTAASHLAGDTVSIVRYPSDLADVVCEIARLRYHARGQGMASVTQDSTLLPAAYPGSEEMSVCKRLAWYKGRAIKVKAF